MGKFLAAVEAFSDGECFLVPEEKSVVVDVDV